MFHLVAVLAATTPTTTKSSSGGLNSILDPIARPVAWVLEQLYALIPNYAVAILLLAVLWMIIISPLTLKTTRSMLAMSKLQPQLKKLQEQHRNDRQAFAQAQMELFREHNVSPFGSCLPTLLPLPVFFALFRVIDGLGHTTNGVPNPLFLSHTSRMYNDIKAAHGHLNALGIDLSKNALSHHSSFAAALPFFFLVLIMMGTQYIQTVQAMSRNPAAQQSSQARIMKFLPLIFGLFCIRFPAGVVLYYAMSNVCRIIQQGLMYRYDPKVKALVAEEVTEIEAKTRELDEHPGRSPGTTPQPAPPARKRFRDLLAEEASARQQQRQRGSSPPAQKPAPPKGATAPKGKATPPKTAAKKAGQGSGAGPTPPLGVRRGLFANRNSTGAPPALPQKGGSQAPANGTAAGSGGRAPGSSSGSSGSGSGDRAKTGGGGKPAKSGAAGGRTGGGAGAPRGHRTNRKRRGR